MKRYQIAVVESMKLKARNSYKKYDKVREAESLVFCK